MALIKNVDLQQDPPQWVFSLSLLELQCQQPVMIIWELGQQYILELTNAPTTIDIKWQIGTLTRE